MQKSIGKSINSLSPSQYAGLFPATSQNKDPAQHAQTIHKPTNDKRRIITRVFIF